MIRSARAHYLYQGPSASTAPEPWKIGQAASSGCIRMLNEDVVDLYDRVPVGATVLVKRGGVIAPEGSRGSGSDKVKAAHALSYSGPRSVPLGPMATMNPKEGGHRQGRQTTL